MALKNEDLQALIKRCKKGESLAFTEIYNLYGRVLFGIALRYAKDTMEAEDVLQESFIKIFDKVIDFDFKGSFEGWLKRVVVNTALNKCAKNKSLRESYEIENIELEYEETITSDLSNMELLELIKKLPDGYQMVFNMYVIEGYSHKEIAKMLKISEGTSKSQLSKAKGLLRKMLAKYDMV